MHKHKNNLILIYLLKTNKILNKNLVKIISILINFKKTIVKMHKIKKNYVQTQYLVL